MKNLRQAALTLHKLEEVDRRWLMRQLSSDHQLTLSNLIQELRELGISSFDAETTLLDLKSTSISTHHVSGDTSLNACSAQVVFVELMEEPDAVVGAILAASPWRWRDGVLIEFGKIGRGERIQKAMSTVAANPKFLQAMVSRLTCAVMRREATHEAPLRRRTWLGQLRNRIGSWLL